MAKQDQIEKFIELHEQLGIAPSKTELRKFKNKTNSEAFEEVRDLIQRVRVHTLFNFTPEPGMVGPKRLRQWERKRREVGQPVTIEDVEWAKAQTDDTVNRDIARLAREHQARLDDLGVTPSASRYAHHWYDDARLLEGQRKAAARRIEREEQAAVDRRLRGIGKPPRVEKQHPYDRATRGR